MENYSTDPKPKMGAKCQMVDVLESYLDAVVLEMRQQRSATIAAAIEPHSIEQALGIVNDVHWAMYPTLPRVLIQNGPKQRMLALKRFTAVEINVSELLPVVVAHDIASVQFLDCPRRREAAV